MDGGGGEAKMVVVELTSVGKGLIMLRDDTWFLSSGLLYYKGVRTNLF